MIVSTAKVGPRANAARSGKLRRVERIVLDLPAGAFHALHAGRGRPLIYLHGFPDHPPNAVPFLDELCARGYRVLAPWLRGYAPSPTRGPFDLDTLAGDVRALIDQWSPAQPVDVVGHDWGAAITQVLCASSPERIHRAVTLALPHVLTFARQLRSPAQLAHSWYMLLFQLPGSAHLVRAPLIDLLWRRWSPSFTLDPARRAALHAGLAASLPAPLGYYRTFWRHRLRMRAIATPLLELHGADDGCVLPPTIDDRQRFTGPRVREVVPDVGHFLHLEAPAEIAERVATWLHSRPDGSPG